MCFNLNIYFESQYYIERKGKKKEEKNTYLRNIGLKLQLTTFVGIFHVIFVLPFLSLSEKAVYNNSLTIASK